MIAWARKIGLTQIDGPERRFATIIKANPELDLRNAARSKIAYVSSADLPVVSAVVGTVVVSAIYGSTGAVIAIVSTGVSGVASVIAIVVSRYETTLVVKDRITGKVGSDTKNSVESVSLNSGLNRRGGGSGSYGIGASAASGSVGLTSIHELVAHKLGYNPDVLSRTVGVRFCAKSNTDSAPRETYTEMRWLDGLTHINGTERGLFPAIETLAELDLGYGTGTEVSDIPDVVGVVFTTVVVGAIVGVGVMGRRVGGIIGWRIDSTSTISTKGESVRLRSTHDGSPLSRVKKQVKVVRRVLSLNEPIKLTVLRGLLAKDGIPESRWIRREVWRGVLLSLTVLYGRGDHLGLSGGVELAGSVCRVV